MLGKLTLQLGDTTVPQRCRHLKALLVVLIISEKTGPLSLYPFVEVIHRVGKPRDY